MSEAPSFVMPAEQVRFTVPPRPVVSKGWAQASIASLVVFFVVSAAALYFEFMRELGAWQATGRLPWWPLLPFLFTTIGSFIGMVLEAQLYLRGIPFEQTFDAGATFVFKLRLLNLAPVSGSVLFFVLSITVQDESLRIAMLYVVLLASSLLAAALALEGPPAFVAATLNSFLLLEVGRRSTTTRP